MITVNILTRQFPVNQHMPKIFADLFAADQQLVDCLKQQTLPSCLVLPCRVCMVSPRTIDVFIGMNGIRNNHWHSEPFNKLEDVDVLTIINFEVESDTLSSTDLEPFSMFAFGSRSESLLACLMAGFVNLRKNDIHYDNLNFKDNSGAHITSHYLSNLKKWKANNWYSKAGEKLKYAEQLQKLYAIMYDDACDCINAIMNKELGNFYIGENHPRAFILRPPVQPKQRPTVQQEEPQTAQAAQEPKVVKNLSSLFQHLQSLRKLKKDIVADNQLSTDQQQKLIDLLDQATEIILDSQQEEQQ